VEKAGKKFFFFFKPNKSITKYLMQKNNEKEKEREKKLN
jgi:hypothetical protein